jgi:PAS domain S-box-containing protein
MTIPDVETQAHALSVRTAELDRLRTLVEASGWLLGSLRVEDVLPRVLDLAQRTLAADAYALWRYDSGTREWTIAEQAGLSPEYRDAVVRAIATAGSDWSLEAPLVAEDVGTAEWLSPEHRAAHAREGTQSLLVVGLRDLERVLGTLAFYYRHPHQFPEEEQTAAVALANLAAASLVSAEHYDAQATMAEERERLLRESERARTESEQVHERLAVLADASSQLASTLDYESTLANIATLLVPRYADWYAADVVEGDGYRRLAVVHKDPEKAGWAARSRDRFGNAPGEPEGTGRVIRTGEPVLYRRISDDLLRSSTMNEEHYETLKQLGMESAMVVPLTAGGRTFGALMLVSADPAQLYDQEDLDFAMHLGRRAAVAIDNARLYRETQERAQAALVVEHVGDGVLLVDEDDVVRLWNPSAERITGLDAAAAVGRPAADIFRPWESLAPLAEDAATAPETRPVEVNGRELWLSITGVAFAGGVVFAFRDLTAEQAVERLKSDFVATVSHELRTPLAAVYGAALTLRREDVRLSEPQRTGLLEVISGEADRLARIVNDILWASRLESGALPTTIQACDGVDLARGVVEAAESYIPPNIHLHFEAAVDAPRLAADPDKVRQVLGNLVENAIKYSPDGGEVSLTVAPAAADRLRFTVRDDGLGVPPAEQKRIFEKFYRLDPQLTRGVGGTGLGLYICRELIVRMGGRIWVESDGQRGSEFVVELPTAA